MTERFGAQPPHKGNRRRMQDGSGSSSIRQGGGARQRAAAAATASSPTRASILGGGSTIVSIGTTALALYGACQLASLAYQAWNELQEEEESEIEQEQTTTRTAASASSSVPGAASLWQSLWTNDNTKTRGISAMEHNENATTAMNIGKEGGGRWWWTSGDFRGNTDQHDRDSSAAATTTTRRHRCRYRRQQIQQCRLQVRKVLDRLIPSVVKRLIMEATDFQVERRSLQTLRRRIGAVPAPTASASLATDSSTVASSVNANADSSSSTDNNNNSNSDVNGSTQQQQEHQQQAMELELWKIIVSQSITRLVLTIYAPSLLFVISMIQVSVMLSSSLSAALHYSGRRVTDPKSHSSDDYYGPDDIGGGGGGAQEEEEVDAEKWVLDQTYQYMFQQGLPSLMDTVQRIVSTVLAENQQELQIMVAGGNMHSRGDISINNNNNRNGMNHSGTKEEEGSTTTNNTNRNNGNNYTNDSLLQPITPSQLASILQQVHMRLRLDVTCRRERSLLRFVQPPRAVLGFHNGDDDDDDDDEEEEEIATLQGGRGSKNEESSSSHQQHHHPDDQSLQRQAVQHNQQQQQQQRRRRRRRMELFDATWDVLESPMVEDALHDSLRVLQKLFIHDIFQSPLPQDEQTEKEEEQQRQQQDDLMMRPRQQRSVSSWPLAQLLTRIKESCQVFYSAFGPAGSDGKSRSHDNANTDHQQTATNHHLPNEANTYLQALEQLPPVMEAMDYFFSD